MSESQDFHRFIIGETRVDGWISDWRKDFNSYMEKKYHIAPSTKAVPVFKRKPFTPTESQKARHLARQRVTNRNRRDRMRAEGTCVDCNRAPAISGRTLCDPCRLDRSTRERNKRLKKAA